MGHKVNPIGFRLGVIKDWQSKWYSKKNYAEYLLEDLKLRKAIKDKYREAGISRIDIERQVKDITITLHTARPGIVIGRGGQRIDEMRIYLEGLIGKKIKLNIIEIRQPELDAYLVGRNIAEQIEHRVAYRRAMKQAMFRTMQSGAKGIKVNCGGRLGGAEIARRQTMHQGQVPLHTLRADIDYGFTEAHTTMGRIGIKVWVYKGEVLPEIKKVEAAAEAPAVAAKPVEATPALPGTVGAAIEAAVKAAAAAEAPKPAAVAPIAPVVAEAEKVAKPRVRKAKAKAEVQAEVKAEAPIEAPVAAVEPAKPAAAEKPAKPRAKRTTKKATAETEEKTAKE